MIRKAPEWLNLKELNKDISASALLGCRRSVKVHLLKTSFHSLSRNDWFQSLNLRSTVAAGHQLFQDVLCWNYLRKFNYALKKSDNLPGLHNKIISNDISLTSPVVETAAYPIPSLFS